MRSGVLALKEVPDLALLMNMTLTVIFRMKTKQDGYSVRQTL